MKLSILAISVGIAMLAGCASNNYDQYAKTQQQVAKHRADAEIARYKALEAIANSGDTTARVAAVIALQQGASSNPDNSPRIEKPVSASDTALKWAGVLFPSLTQLYGINRNAEVAIVNSNNSLDGKKDDNDMIVDLVKGRAPIIGTQDDVLLYPTQ